MTEPVNNLGSRKRGGRPKGSRNKRTLLAEKMFSGEAEAIIRSCIEGAKARDPVCMKLAIERICPAAKGRTVSFDLGEVRTAAQIDDAVLAVLKACAIGRITPDEMATITKSLRDKSETLAVREIAAQVKELQERYGPRGSHLRTVS